MSSLLDAIRREEQQQQETKAKVLGFDLATGNPITEDDLKAGFKADAGKARIDLIPADVLMELGKLYAKGAEKYADNNWKLGMDYGRVYSAMMRHALKFWSGEEFDPDGQHHLDSVIWNAITLRYFQLHREKYAQFDDRNREPVRAEEKGQK